MKKIAQKNHPLTPEELLLNIKSDIVLRVGKICLASGTGSFRVKQSMHRVAQMLGLENQAHITLTEINLTCREGHRFNTEVGNLSSFGVNADRIGQIEALLIDLEKHQAHYNQQQLINYLDAQLTLIEQKRGLYTVFKTAIFSALACSSFTFLIGGGLIEIIGVFFAAGFGQYLRKILLVKNYNQFLVTMLAAIVATSIYVIIMLGMENIQHQAGYIAAMLFLIPGFPLITGVMDIIKYDFSSGIQRLTYAMTIILCATFSAWMIASVFQIEPLPLIPPTLTPLNLLLLRLLTSFLGVLGFALMFNSPVKTAIISAIIGMIANTLRLEIIELFSVPEQAAALLATFLVGLGACFAAEKFRCPRISLSIPAVCIMVPGVFMFRAVYYLEQHDILNAINWSAQAFIIVLALPLGLVWARILTDKEWGKNVLNKVH